MADKSSFVGARLRITTGEGDYEGIVHSIDTVKRKLTLTKVVSCSTGSKLHGFHHFFGHELNNLELLDEPNNNTSNDQQTEAKKINYTKDHEKLSQIDDLETSNSCHSRPASHKSNTRFGDSSSRCIRKAFKDAGIGINSKLGVKKTEVSSGSLSRDASDEGGSLLKRTPIEPEKYLSDMLSDEDEKENVSPDLLPTTVVVDCFGEIFEEAIKIVSKQRVIGVCCEGVNLGRFGKICWLVIGCSKFIYLFDILSLGAPCFDEGLQDILESGDILKVIHDCRQVSDALFHQYQVRLVNVFDTQVADVIVYRNESGGELPRHVNGLVACLYEYLNLSPENVHFQKVRQKYMKRKESIWADRPSPAALVDAAAKHVMYLRELRLAQMERIMAEFIYGVNIYLSVVRDAKEVNPKVKSQVLPAKFHTLKQFSCRQRSRPYDGDFHEDAVNGVPEDVLANRHAWNEGQEFAEDYENKKGRVKERIYNGPPIPAPPPLERQFDDSDVTPTTVERPPGSAPTAVDRLRQALRESTSGIDSEAPVTREQAVKVPSVKSTPVVIPTPAPPVFTEQDFPPLSSSESEGPGTPPRSSPMNKAIAKKQTSRNFQMGERLERNGVPKDSGRGPYGPGSQSISSQRASELLRESAALPGRGRAGALLRHAAMPALRLPAEDGAFGGGYSFNRPSETRTDEFLFPSDEELLAAPEIIPVPRHQISGGTQVRIKQT